jgi:hypothetical protein
MGEPKRINPPSLFCVSNFFKYILGNLFVQFIHFSQRDIYIILHDGYLPFKVLNKLAHSSSIDYTHTVHEISVYAILVAQGPVGTRGRGGVDEGALCLQDPIRSSTFIRRGADTLPVMVVNIHYRPLPAVPLSRLIYETSL